MQLAANVPLKSLLDLQRIGRYNADAPVFIDINRYDPLCPGPGPTS